MQNSKAQVKFKYSSAQYNTVQYSAAQVKYSTVQCNAVQFIGCLLQSFLVAERIKARERVWEGGWILIISSLFVKQKYTLLKKTGVFTTCANVQLFFKPKYLYEINNTC